MTDIREKPDIVRVQQDICRKFGSPVMLPDEASKLGIAMATLDSMPITAIRLYPENGTNGWYIHGGEFSDNDDFYQPLHLSHIAEMLPQVLPYLALAPGYKFLIDNNGYEDVWYDPESLRRRE